MVVICMRRGAIVLLTKSDKNTIFGENMEFLGYWRFFLDDVSMTSSGGVGYGRVTWRPVSGPRGLLRWRTAWIHGGPGADATLSGMTWV